MNLLLPRLDQQLYMELDMKLVGKLPMLLLRGKLVIMELGLDLALERNLDRVCICTICWLR